jgi:hypothetical protein
MLYPEASLRSLAGSIDTARRDPARPPAGGISKDVQSGTAVACTYAYTQRVQARQR